jgi:hypothetical protein
MTRKVLFVFSFVLLLAGACSSSRSSGYQPKYKKPNPNKPLPCPQKDC